MICSVVGARPNFMKMAPVVIEARRRGVPNLFVHTGQHYDASMSAVFFDELHMPKPDTFLGVGSCSHAEQTARVMIAFEQVLVKHLPELVIVAGDVNSTLACALAAAKLNIPVAHVEAGLRSFDREMPEEINRLLTDHISDILLTSEPSGNDNLRHEGIAAEKIHYVGNCMIDSLLAHRATALERRAWEGLGVAPHTYGLVTVHRPAMVDDPLKLDQLRQALSEIARSIPLLFPVHPRTRKRMETLDQPWEPVKLIDPLGYLDFLGLMANARLVLTDSGGIQEETTALGVPCATLRNNTERPVTVEMGTNRIAGTDRDGIVKAAREILAEEELSGRVPHLWDGKAAVRVMDVVERWRSQNGHRNQ
ncbi:MAG: UDP-N-acetylglucosamine 2-epimerase (non-hydrolyzing) [Bacteroidota bacterium]